MPYQDLLILLPCHSLEDFPTHHDGEDAEGLLAHWTALWHPALIASAGKAPQWVRVDDPPQEFADRLISVPNVAKDRLPTGFAQRAKESGATVLRNLVKREEILAAALAPLGELPAISADLAADFLALGYAYLQVQLLTRQMRYSSSLDEVYFKGQAVEAAKSAAQGDEASARERLSSCFSLLAEERDRYYPVDAFLVDLTMLADTTLGPSLREELASQSPRNLLFSAELLEQLVAREPASHQAMLAALESNRIGILGGEDRERRLPLLSLEDIRTALVAGRQVYEQHLERKPEIFGRRRFGLSPGLPQVLRKIGYLGAFHATLEEGRFPEGIQFKIGWEGSDGTALDAIARPPLDASLPKTFLHLATKLGESMDQDHVATLLLAHWPGQGSPYYADLQRTARYSACLGRFVTIEQYFQESNPPGQMDRFEADRYKSPYLKQAVIRKQADPLSSIVRYWRRRAAWEAAETMHALADLVAGKPSPLPEELLTGIVGEQEAPPEASNLDERLEQLHREQAERLAQAICPNRSSSSGYLVLNPYACVRRTGVDGLQVRHLPESEKPIYATGEQGERKQAVVDVPAFGFVWVPSAEQPPRPRRAQQALFEAPNLLRNEFFEATINTTTGALQSVHEYSSRRNRISQQLAIRTPGPAGKPGDVYRDPDETAQYSVMGADSVEVTCSTAAMGEITVRGRLMNLEGERIASFTEVFRVWRGSRVLRIDVEVEPLEELKSDPWNSYLACRFAWGDEAAGLLRTIHQQRHETTTKFLEAPHYLEIDHGDKRTAIFTAGLPFHRRSGPAMLDSLLLVRGERARRFTLGIGIDVQHPMHEAMALLAPPVPVPVSAQPPKSGGSGWLAHIDSRNVIHTHLRPLVEGGKVMGFRMRLLESAGRAAEVSISAFRSIAKANKVDFRGHVLDECSITDGKAKVSLSGHEWAEVEAHW
jgi:alpha-mannosidase